jgi:hypothetical protein
MKDILPIAFILIYNLCTAQVTKEFPIDNNGRILFTNVIELDNSTTKKDLYNRSKIFFVESFNSANDVIQLDNKEDVIIIIIIDKGSTPINMIENNPSVVANLNYTLKLKFKDGQYKYDIYDLRFDVLNTSTALEDMYNEKRYASLSERLKTNFQYSRDKVILEINSLISLLNKKMRDNKNK